MDHTAVQWYKFGAKLVSENHLRRKPKNIKKDGIADVFDGEHKGFWEAQSTGDNIPKPQQNWVAGWAAPSEATVIRSGQ